MTHSPSQRIRRAGVLASVIGALALGGSTVYSQQIPAPTPTPPATLNAMEQLSNGFVDVASQTLPAVVSIRVDVESHEPAAPRGFPFPFPFGGGGGGGRGGAPEIQHGTGSGVIVRPDGVIVTNNHVVEDARRIMVHLRDGRVLPARVLGTDPATDLAAIKIEATGLPVARWGDSERARVGEWVLAIGAPFGLEATVTHGVLSAKGRAGLGQTSIEDYLQTDASINPGNSGGPLINLRGEVLGINTMILGRGTGVGFAVPSRLARLVTEQLAERGSVTRGWIGLGLQDLTADLASNFNLPPGGGALVSQIDARGPSARAGLALGDVITSVDGRPVTSSNDVVQTVTGHRPNDAITLAVLRNGQARALRVVAGTRPDADNPRAPRDRGTAAPRMEGSRNLGLEVAPIPVQRARQLGVDRGVMVTVVEPGGAGDRAGLRPGDVIMQADQQPVGNSGDLLTATQDGRAALLVRRNNGQTFVPLTLD
jgi:Do/DeqQ family serine protease